MTSSRDNQLLNTVSRERLELMERGLVELSKWVADLVSNGISTLVQGADEPWESIAVRMVDYKLGGIAGYLRNMINRDDHQLIEDWHFDVIKLVAYLEALITGFQKARKQENVPSVDILKACGVNFKREDIKKIQKGILDCWRVLYVETNSNAFVVYHKLYLWGRDSNQLALVLDFKGRDSNGELPWYLIRNDVQFEAELFFHPSAFPVRGFLEKIKPIDYPTFTPIEKTSNPEFLTVFADQPFAISFPVLLTHCQIQDIHSGHICWNNLQLPCQLTEDFSEDLTEDILNQSNVILAEWNGWHIKILRIIKD
jgi:hypothetical protein